MRKGHKVRLIKKDEFEKFLKSDLYFENVRNTKTNYFLNIDYLTLEGSNLWGCKAKLISLTSKFDGNYKILLNGQEYNITKYLIIPDDTTKKINKLLNVL